MTYLCFEFIFLTYFYRSAYFRIFSDRSLSNFLILVFKSVSLFYFLLVNARELQGFIQALEKLRETEHKSSIGFFNWFYQNKFMMGWFFSCNTWIIFLAISWSKAVFYWMSKLFGQLDHQATPSWQGSRRTVRFG